MVKLSQKKGKHSSVYKIVITVAIVVLLAGIAGAGYKYYKNDGSFVENKSQETQQPSDVAQSTPAPTTQSAEVAEGQYLVIEDWGVKFKIPSELSSTDVRYKVQKYDYASYAFITTARIESLGGRCNQSNPNTITPLTLTQSKEKPTGIPHGKLITSEPINGFYYSYTLAPVDCSSDGGARATSQIELDDVQSLEVLMGTLEAAK